MTWRGSNRETRESLLVSLIQDGIDVRGIS